MTEQNPVGTADVFALTKLFDDVSDRFSAEGTSVDMSFGWREPAQQKTAQHRIVWVPGDPSGLLGELLGARFPGRNPRPLATLGELFHVVISGSDPTRPEDERAQYVATRRLFDAWYRAVYLAAHGTVTMTSATWLVSIKERREGAAILATCAIASMIPDLPLELVPTPVGAALDVAELDTTDTVEVSA